MTAVPPVRLRAPVIIPCDGDGSVIRDGVLDVDRNGRIVHCGSLADAPDPSAGASSSEYHGILMPGLINAHAHGPMTLLRGMGGELELLRWLREVIWPAESRLRRQDVRAGMELAAVEMLRAGVTTSAEMYVPGEAIAEAVLEVGSRVVLGQGIVHAPELPGLGSWQRLVSGVESWIDADGLRFGPGERVELSYGPHSAYTLPEEALRAVADSAHERGALVQIHVAESADEDAAQRAAHGSVPALLDKLGVLRCRVLAAHAVHLSDQDIELFAHRRVGVAHCPGSNAKLASGLARLTDLRAAGIAVGVGTDGASSNDDLNLWEDVELAAMLARLSTNDATALSAREALLMATREAADALGRDDIGVLEPGRYADVIHVDVDDPAFATGLDAADEQVLANLVWAAGSRRVSEAWVAGEQVLADAEPVRVQRAAVQARAHEAARHIRG